MQTDESGMATGIVVRAICPLGEGACRRLADPVDNALVACDADCSWGAGAAGRDEGGLEKPVDSLVAGDADLCCGAGDICRDKLGLW